ncbi:hypothetical protein HU200_033314 [Digitaria exilis]|uniref:Uncharacterized protein n=1 Tax=Digitaria exilis TaxID=1010633 RepID=A0A835BLH7_9POAL|nr:hypothetical protein HU200_033314 [Digitaria exilis]
MIGGHPQIVKCLVRQANGRILSSPWELGQYGLWNHCNRCVFDRIHPRINVILVSVEELQPL